MTDPGVGRRKIAFGGHGAPSPLDSISKIRRAFPCRRAYRVSKYPRDRPLLLGERIGRIENEVASVPTTFIVPGQHGHLCGSSPQIFMMRSHQSGWSARPFRDSGSGRMKSVPPALVAAPSGLFASVIFGRLRPVFAAIQRLLFE